jgi:hypoxanthine phosphoribosyltransferase
MIDQAILSRSQLIYTHEEIVSAIDLLAGKLNRQFKNKKALILPVLTGAIPFVGMLLPRLSFTIEVNYFHVSRYQNNVGTNQIKITHQPSPESVLNQEVLVLDDILDEGITLNLINEQLITMKPKSITNVVLFEKQLDIKKEISADYVGLDVPDAYVFGFGLDFNGAGRNIPDLYAFNEEY